MGFSLTNRQLSLLEKDLVASIATINLEGIPQVSPAWVTFQDGKIYYIARMDQPKGKNIVNNSKVGILLYELENKLIASISGEGKIRTNDDFPIYKNVMERIVRKYIPDHEKATSVIDKLINDENRLLVEVVPKLIYSEY